MATPNNAYTPHRPAWIRKSTMLAAGVGAALLVTAWGLLLFSKPRWIALSVADLAACLSGSAYALNARPLSGRLLGFGSKYVQVRSLDEWTLYQYGLPFDKSSPEQQNKALAHYRVGLRLFPARPQDVAPKQSSWQWLLSVLTFCAVITTSQAVHGWYRFLILIATMRGFGGVCESPDASLAPLRPAVSTSFIYDDSMTRLRKVQDLRFRSVVRRRRQEIFDSCSGVHPGFRRRERAWRSRLPLVRGVPFP